MAVSSLAGKPALPSMLTDAAVTLSAAMSASTSRQEDLIAPYVDDLVSYDRKHNEANGNDNAYSQDNEISWFAQASPFDVVEREHQTAHAAPRYRASARSVLALEAR